VAEFQTMFSCFMDSSAMYEAEIRA
jgi:hypothetical protein